MCANRALGTVEHTQRLSVSLDIAYRTCSRCLTYVPADLTECACGHSFALDKPAPARVPSKPRRARTVEVTRTVEAGRSESEEQRCETFLEKRLQQALETLRRVRTGGDSKWGEEQIENVGLALKAVEVARKELAAHREQTSHLMATKRSTGRIQKQRQTPRSEAPKPEKIAVRDTHMPAAPDFAPAMPEKQQPTPRPEAPKPEKIAVRDTSMPAAPDFAPAMPEKQRAAQSTRAEQLHKPAPLTQDCPHCSAIVAADASHCGCGYEFAGTVLMPPIVLPVEEKNTAKPSRTKSA